MIKSLEIQLTDARFELEQLGSIDDTPSNLEDYDEGEKTAELIAEISGRIATIAKALVIERGQMRNDFVEELHERAARLEEVHGVQSHHLL